MLAELRPVDFYALIDTLRIAIPIAEKILTSIVKPLYDQQRASQPEVQPLGQSQNSSLSKKRGEIDRIRHKTSKMRNKVSTNSSLPSEKLKTMRPPSRGS